jgi:hypothetical protein
MRKLFPEKEWQHQRPAKNNLFPIPLTELQNNSAPGLKAQNPGY